MCGIAGFLDAPGAIGDPRATLARMASILRHRGPDACGIHWNGDAIGLAHTRLAILDRSAAGAQPMVSHSGRWIVAYNGEVYNHLDMRRDLGDGVAWRGTSDTETLLACLDRWGTEHTVRRLDGMFAIAAWDTHERTLWMARDAIGKKPLLYGWFGGVFAFASEAHALSALPAWPPPIDRAALATYARYHCVPAPHTIYLGFRKLMPGTLARLSANDHAPVRREPDVVQWWSARDAALGGSRDRAAGDRQELAERAEGVLRRAVRKRLQSDVPVGAFLSGGIDSGVVTALMVQECAERVHTFSVGFAESEYDERPLARAVAGHLGTDHTDFLISPTDALDAAMDVGAVWDEPFADSSAIPSLVLARCVKPSVSVVLTGDGGDELFGGYQRYHHAHRLWSRTAMLPPSVRRVIVAAMLGTPDDAWRVLNALLPDHPLGAHAARAVHRGVQALSAASLDTLPKSVMTMCNESARLVPGTREAATVLDDFSALPDLGSFEERFMLADLLAYLPDDLLVKVDRSSMSVGLEARCPLLDGDVVSCAFGLPLHERISDGGGKPILRALARQWLPEAVLQAPKRGFAVPLAAWLRGPLRVWAGDMLSSSTTKRCDLFDDAAVLSLATRFRSGEHDLASSVWAIATAHSWSIHARRLVHRSVDTLPA